MKKCSVCGEDRKEFMGGQEKHRPICLECWPAMMDLAMVLGQIRFERMLEKKERKGKA